MKTLMTAAAMTLMAGTAMATETDNVIKHLDGGHTEVDHYIQYDEVEANNVQSKLVPMMVPIAPSLRTTVYGHMTTAHKPPLVATMMAGVTRKR